MSSHSPNATLSAAPPPISQMTSGSSCPTAESLSGRSSCRRYDDRKYKGPRAPDDVSDGPAVDWHSDYEWWAANDEMRSFNSECAISRAIADARRRIAWQRYCAADPFARRVLAAMAAAASFGKVYQDEKEALLLHV